MLKTALIVAGGSGTRMGASVPKQFLSLAGKPILVHTVLRYIDYDPALRLVLVIPQAHFSFWEELAGDFLSKEALARIQLCAGGKSRTESVSNGLALLATIVENTEQALVAIHDGVRPFVSAEMIDEAFSEAAEHGASVACVPVKASLRQKKEGKSKAVDRAQFLEVQTPQTFYLNKIYRCYRKRPHDRFTDDASLYEALEGDVSICDGSYNNIKITTPVDLIVAEQLINQ